MSSASAGVLVSAAVATAAHKVWRDTIGFMNTLPVNLSANQRHREEHQFPDLLFSYLRSIDARYQRI